MTDLIETKYNEEMENLISSSEVEELKDIVDKKVNKTFEPRNRAEKRAAAKASKKKNKDKQYFMDNIQEAAKRLTYIRLIQKLREMNKEGEANETTSERNSNV